MDASAVAMDASAVAFERATIESDGETLAARWYAGDEDAALPVVVLSHPHTKFGGSSGMMDGLARELVVRGRLRVLCVDTRGAGRSSGAATWTGWDEMGYTCGYLCSVLWRGHFGPYFSSPKPKLFLHGSKDEHTSVPQLKSWIRRAPDAAELEVFEGVGHYELESPSYDGDVAARIVRFIADRGLRA
ncbi:hypothetical protein JL722_298 [Aureococcus anophagefferens]|nr:hypothetical protein JL722_298 [Aureococcus anophagefferens]